MRPEHPRNEPQQPPPLPTPAVAPALASPPRFARARAFLAIQRLRADDLARRAVAAGQRHPAAVASGFAAVLVLAGAAVAAGLGVLPGIPAAGAAAPAAMMAEARAVAAARPDDATLQRDLGHALWAARKRPAALAAYRHAVALDPGVADDQVIANLLAAFGTPEQRTAEGIIWKAKLVAAEPGLQRLVRSKQPDVRWGAVHTLDRLGKGSKAHWETAYVVDLGSPDCDVRRAAVEKLGEIGTRRAVAALRESRAADEKTGGFLRRRCLGGRLDDAEQKILARR
jgi:hypothetical protein